MVIIISPYKGLFLFKTLKQKHMYQGYVITGIKGDGLRHMALNNNHTNTHKTQEGAQQQLDNILNNNNAKTIAETLGKELRIDPVECYDSGDSSRTIF